MTDRPPPSCAWCDQPAGCRTFVADDFPGAEGFAGERSVPVCPAHALAIVEQKPPQ
jgi:hypothetical protein